MLQRFGCRVCYLLSKYSDYGCLYWKLDQSYGILNSLLTGNVNMQLKCNVKIKEVKIERDCGDVLIEHHLSGHGKKSGKYYIFESFH